MKATVDAAAFAKAVKAAGSFIGATHLAALSMIRLAATEDSLELVAGDLEHWVSIDVPAEVAADGTVLVAAHSLVQVAGHFAGTVDLVAEDDALRLLGGDRQAEFRCGDLTAYPVVEWPDSDPMPLGDAWPRLRRILHAASRDRDKQTTLRSVMLQADGTAMCTDSYRLAWCDFPAPTEDLLVPIEGVERVARLLGDEVSMAVADNSVAWSTPSMTIMSRLVVGQVPNWRGQLRPVPHSFEVDAAELLDAVAMVSALNERGVTGVIRLRFVDGRLELGRAVQDVGVTRAEVDVTGEWPFEAGVNPRFLTEAVRAVQAGGAERVTVRAESALKPFRVHGGDVEQLIMPVKIP